MGCTDQALAPGEQVVYRARPHGGIFSWAVLELALGLACAAVATPLSAALTAAQVLSISAIVLFVVAGVARERSEVLVTDRRLVFHWWALRWYHLDLPLSEIDTVVVDQSMLGRWLGYGSVYIVGAAGTQQKFDAVGNPRYLRQLVLSESGKAAEPAPERLAHTPAA